jgi:hypothetical protein
MRYKSETTLAICIVCFTLRVVAGVDCPHPVDAFVDSFTANSSPTLYAMPAAFSHQASIRRPRYEIRVRRLHRHPAQENAISPRPGKLESSILSDRGASAARAQPEALTACAVREQASGSPAG